MNTIKHFFLLLFLFLPGVLGANQTSANAVDLHAEIAQVYDFQPHNLDKKQIEEKSAVLDQFWSKAKSQREIYVPQLRRELANFSNPSFFLYDGSKLLLSLSNDPADRKIVLAAIIHSDLHDLQLIDYFLLVHNMAVQGEDTTAAAFHILDEPKFQVFIPQHVLTLAQNYSLIYMLFPEDQGFWLKPAIERLRTEQDETAQKSLLLLLWYAQTPDSDGAIAAFYNDASKENASRSFANELAHRKDSLSMTDRAAALSFSSEESLRRERRERMKSVSDEALMDFDTYTLKIIEKRK